MELILNKPVFKLPRLKDLFIKSEVKKDDDKKDDEKEVKKN
jgi:hypothetical protein